MADIFKHTQGPWEVRNYSFPTNEVMVVAADGMIVGKTLGRAVGTGTSIDDHSTNLANAKLFAAAPKLLEAIRTIRDKAFLAIPSAIGFTQDELQEIAEVADEAFAAVKGK